MGILAFAIRLFAALLFGVAIGIERQWRQKSAGLRTNTLVSLGSAAFILLSINIVGDAVGRVASYIITAKIRSAAPQDSLMERVASRLTIEEKVMKVSWEITGTQSEL